MGAKGPLAIVSPTEWVRRTSLTFKKRSADTLRLDEAYQAAEIPAWPVCAG